MFCVFCRVTSRFTHRLSGQNKLGHDSYSADTHSRATAAPTSSTTLRLQQPAWPRFRKQPGAGLPGEPGEGPGRRGPSSGSSDCSERALITASCAAPALSSSSPLHPRAPEHAVSAG